MATIGPGDVSLLVQFEFDDHLVGAAGNVVDVHSPLVRVLVDRHFKLGLGRLSQRPNSRIQSYLIDIPNVSC